MHPIITSKDMALCERLAYSRGYSERDFMESAGQKIASFVQKIANPKNKWIHLLCGKGNNGADGIVAGCHLLNAGYYVSCMRPDNLSSCSALFQENYERYITLGGKETQTIPSKCAFILDAIFGTGFHGVPKVPFQGWIQQANASGIPRIALDIPSGLNGDTGAIEGEAIHASYTLYLGLPKKGFFFEKGPSSVGKLERIDFGLPEDCIDPSRIQILLQTLEGVHLPPLKRDQHKYQAGYVAGIGGMGALFLAGLAALRSGCGIVKLFHPPALQINAPLELIHFPYESLQETLKLTQKANSIFIGPGMGVSDWANLKELFSSLQVPLVIDADALNLMAKNKIKIPPDSILTPHRGEFENLIDRNLPAGITDQLIYIGTDFSNVHHCTLILKGSPSVIFHPNHCPIFCDRGDPGMATAGTGDALTGILSALLANGNSTLESARYGVCLHGVAGEMAAQKRGSRSMIASDLIERLGDALKSLI